MFEYITMDSFGSDLPENWEEIANRLNKILADLITDEMSEDERHDLANEIWDTYWNGHLYWYAVQRDTEDDWGTGSYSLDEAKAMLRDLRADYPNSLIAVIDNSTSNPVCVDEIRDI